MPDNDKGRRPPFDLLKACFWLLAIIVTFQVVGSFAAGVLCWWSNWSAVGPHQVGGCLPIDQIIRELWDQILVAILALLVARAPPQ